MNQGRLESHDVLELVLGKASESTQLTFGVAQGRFYRPFRTVPTKGPFFERHVRRLGSWRTSENFRADDQVGIELFFWEFSCE